MSAAIAERFGAAVERARTYDRPLLIIAAILFALGILFSMSASPAATARIQIGEAFYFAGRQAGYAACGIIAMLAALRLTLVRFGAPPYSPLQSSCRWLCSPLCLGTRSRARSVGLKSASSRCSRQRY